MKSLILKDRRRRIISSFYERRAIVLHSIVTNRKLSPQVRLNAFTSRSRLPRDSSFSRSRNRCTFTGRSRAIYRKFGRSRLRFRAFASQGLLGGVKKAS